MAHPPSTSTSGTTAGPAKDAPPGPSAPDATVLQGLAQLVHDIHYEDLPADVVRAAKALILDTLGCAFGALGSPVARAVQAMADDCGGAAHATVIGRGGRTSAPLAALVNGTLLRYLDCNDYYFGRDPAHPSGNLAAALAMAERHGRSGRELIATLVAAYEVHLRLAAHAGEPSLWKRGWHHGTNSQFSNAALAARLAGADAAGIAQAMAIAGSHQNTLAQLQSGAVSMIKASAEAWVAKAAVEAALFARHGMTGPLDVMEGNHGWITSVAGGADLTALLAPCGAQRLEDPASARPPEAGGLPRGGGAQRLEGPASARPPEAGDLPWGGGAQRLEGPSYLITETSIKPYPIVATALAPVRAAIELHRAGLPDLAAIEKIIVGLPAFALGTPSAQPNRRNPASIESAQHSFYYCPAVALMDGACQAPQFTPQLLHDPALQALLARVELAEEAEFNQRWPQAAGGSVTLHMRDGTRHVRRCPYPPGHPRLPLDADDLLAKFHGYADPVLGREGAIALRHAVESLDACVDIREFARLLRGEGDTT